MQAKKYKRVKRYHIPDSDCFVIEPEIIQYVKEWLNKKVSKRVVKAVEEEKSAMGFIGQELLAGLLLQHKIPNVYANPIYLDCHKMRMINGKHFDFIIPKLGKEMQYVSVKTVPEDTPETEYKRFMANVDSWKNEIHDIIVIIKIDSLAQNEAHIAGWLKSSDVESLPVHCFNERYGDAYWTYLKGADVIKNKSVEPKLMILRSAKKFVQLLTG